MRRPRGLTVVGLLMLLAFLAGVYWVIAFGVAYWERLEVKSILGHAANLCYREPNDQRVKEFVFKELHEAFDEKVEDNGRIVTRMRIEVSPDDLEVQRTVSPAYVNIWLTYQRTVRLPIVGRPRTLIFTDHAGQDLSPVKW